MAARSIEAFAVVDEELDTELRLLAGDKPGAIKIEIRDITDPANTRTLDLDPELARQFRLAAEKLSRAGDAK